MSEAKQSDEAMGARTPGARRAQSNEYYFDIANINSIMGGPEYSTVFGGCVEGEGMMVALMRMPVGTGSVPHTHPNEQWVYILEGTMDSTVNGQRRLVPPGGVIYIPANTIHHATASPEGDVVFFTVKDTSHGLHGKRL
jgi:quercetin dioxygenase-like cupin family protein